jgi:hypothetical protein
MCAEYPTGDVLPIEQGVGSFVATSLLLLGAQKWPNVAKRRRFPTLAVARTS